LDGIRFLLVFWQTPTLPWAFSQDKTNIMVFLKQHVMNL